MKRIIILTITIILHFFCTSCDSTNFTPKKEFNLSDSIKLSKISEKAIIERLSSSNTTFEISPLTIIKQFSNNNLVLYDGRYNIFITDLSLKVQKEFNLREKDFYFNGKIEDIVAIGRSIYLLDHSFVIKKLNIDTEDISKIELDIKELYSMRIFNFMFISNINDKLILTPVMSNILPEKEIPLAVIIDKKGNIESVLVIPRNQGDIQIWSKSGDHVFASSINNEIIINFRISRKAYRYSLDGKLISVYTLPVDKKYYSEPKGDEITIDRGGIKETAERVHFIPVTTGPLQYDKAGNAYCLMFQGQNAKQKLAKLDTKFNLKTESVINTISNCCYKLLIADNKIIFHNNNLVHIYD